MVARYDLGRLGWLGFQWLCDAVAGQVLGIGREQWDRDADHGRVADVPGDLAVPARATLLPGPVRVALEWDGEAPAAAPDRSARCNSVLLLTPAPAAHTAHRRSRVPDARPTVILGAEALGRLVDDLAELRLAAPHVLGAGDPLALIPGEARRRSAFDLDAARDLAGAFVPTDAYAATLQVLRRHAFAVLTGPPETGKTAIATMLALALATDGWEVHECVRPDQLWRAFDRSSRQVFVADDAFGSTEYRPDAAERWAVELDRVLRAMDARHWLIWTSRPAPLRAGLARVHREHGVERFPRPAEVQVSAADLTVREKALILYRHARTADLPGSARELVRGWGVDIVEHEHLTPERIRRLVRGPLAAIARTAPVHLLLDVVAEQIRSPTDAMATSLRALDPGHRALLVAMLDVPPGPADERALAAAMRRHAERGLPTLPGVLIERLTDHFLHFASSGAITWVHPSWRDLVIDHLATDRQARQGFLTRCGIDGVMLALSTVGGGRGERNFPLLGHNEDWDLLAERVLALAAADDHDALSALAALPPALTVSGVSDATTLEVHSFAAYVLGEITRRWDTTGRPIAVALLERCLAASATVTPTPPPPALGATWVELTPTRAFDPLVPDDLERLEDWATLVRALDEHAPEALERFAFPGAYREVLSGIARAALDLPGRRNEARERVARALVRVNAALPGLIPAPLEDLMRSLAPLDAPSEPGEPLHRPPPMLEADRNVVGRILDDLVEGW